MSEAETWKCPQCQTVVDISDQGFMSEIMCPGCGMVNTVHTVLHNFRLERVLGVGGMSVVLQARDLVLNRTLAIKVLNETYRNEPERIARFEKECALMAKVRHPNVVSVYSAGVARGQFYIAMELVEGNNLELMVSPMQPMAPLRALSIVRQVAKGLSAANRAGLLHRDIKPGNVLLTRTGRAKVLDFGLSLGKADEDTEETIWATPFYVPPETLRREPEDVRTDIYALGMTLRFLLSGCETFPNVPQTIEELLDCKKNLTRLKCSECGIDETYADLVDHMTAYDINRRSTGYADLLLELDEVRDAQKAYELARTPEGRKLRRKKQLLINFCVLMVSLLSMWLASIIFTPEPQHEAVWVEKGQEQSEDSAWLADAERKLQEGQLADAASTFLQMSARTEDASMGAWGAGVALLISELNVTPHLRYEAEQQWRNHLQRAEGACHPGGAASMAQLCLVDKARTQELTDDERKQVKTPLFKAFLAVSDIHYCAQKSDMTGAEVKKEQALEAFAALPPPYNSLHAPLKAWDGIRLLQAQAVFRRLQDACQRLDYEQILRLSQEAKPFITASFTRRYFAALSEMCKVGKAVDAVLGKKFPSEFKADMSAEARLKLVEKLNNKQLFAEVYILYQFVKGNVNKAFDMNPYRHIPDSTEPFAILARRWFNASVQVNLNSGAESFVLATLQGVMRADAQDCVFSGALSGRIVARCKYGFVVEKGEEEKTYTNYVHVSSNVYCELPEDKPQAVWVELADTGWRGPCCLLGNKLVHPLTGNNADSAQILHRDADSLLIRWEKDQTEAYYKRSAKGLYLRQDVANRPFYHLIDNDGKDYSLMAFGQNSGCLGALRESIYETTSVRVVHLSAQTIRIQRNAGSEEEYVLDNPTGLYRRQGGGSTSASDARLSSAPWLLSKNDYVTGVSLLDEGKRIKIKQGSINREADVVHVDDKSLTVRWSDTRIEEMFNKMPCGAYLTDNLPPGMKGYNIIDYAWRGTCLVGSDDSRIIRRFRQVDTNVKVLEANDSRLRIEYEGKQLTYRNDGKGLYVREPSAEGRVCIFAAHKWKGYMGIAGGKALHFWNPGGGSWATVVEEANDSYTLRWDAYKTVEKFVRQPDGVYLMEGASATPAKKKLMTKEFKDSRSRERVALADLAICRDYYINDQSELVQRDNESVKFSIADMETDKYVSISAANMLKERKLQDGTVISLPRSDAPVKYELKHGNIFCYAKQELPNGGSCEVLMVHDAGWSGPLAVYCQGDVKKAWRVVFHGADSADVLFYDGKKLKIKWHRWGTATYIKDVRGHFVYEDDFENGRIVRRFREPNGFVKYVGIEKGKARYWYWYNDCFVYNVLKLTKEEIQILPTKLKHGKKVMTYRLDEATNEYVLQE